MTIRAGEGGGRGAEGGRKDRGRKEGQSGWYFFCLLCRAGMDE